MKTNNIFQKSSHKLAGVLLLIAGLLIVMGIITAETQYPLTLGYSTAENVISDLGVANETDGISTQPAVAIFNAVMIISGILLVLSSFYVKYAYSDMPLFVAILLLGIGTLGVGAFPSDLGVVHSVFAFTTFFFGGIACILSTKVTKDPFSFIAGTLGVTALIFLLFSGNLSSVFGSGGAERWIAYPITLWMVAFGSYTLGEHNKA